MRNQTKETEIERTWDTSLKDDKYLGPYNFLRGKTQEYDESSDVRIILGCYQGNEVWVCGMSSSGSNWGPIATLVHAAKNLWVL